MKRGEAVMHLPGIVVIGAATVLAPTGTVSLHQRTVRFLVTDNTGGANINLHNKFV